MFDIATVSNAAAASTVLNSHADKVIQQASGTVSENNKIDKSAKDFEAILLGNWLQQAEQSFGSLPGADDEDEDPGKQQFQGLAMESLGNAMTAGGGIGIAKMIAQHLHRAEDVRAKTDGKAPPPVHQR